jgi:hypothetical protein
MNTIPADVQLSMAIAGLRSLATRHVAPDSTDGNEMKILAQEVLAAMGLGTTPQPAPLPAG